MVVVFKACVEHRVLLALGHAFEFAFVEVSETDVFHCSSAIRAYLSLFGVELSSNSLR